MWKQKSNSKFSSLEEFIQNKTGLIENRLGELVAEKESPYNILMQAARYSLLSGGKRLRPLLMLAVAETLNCRAENALDPACAIEMIHTYSLIHDDLPCMDDDDFRRGKPSLHKAFEESQAVLAGDFLLTFAFEVITNASHLADSQKIALIQTLAKSSGSEGMIGGQVMDIISEGELIGVDFLRDIHARKTGALIKAAIECGAIIAQVSTLEMDFLSQFGHEIGFAFQVIDDVLDVTSSKNSDAKNKKSTYVTLLGLDKAKDLAMAHYKSALEKLSQLPYDTFLLADLAEMFVLREK